VLAVLVTQMDGFQRLLGTTDINVRQFLWALVPPVGLLILWEAGKLVARQWGRRTPAQQPAPA
jgi:P-type Ca2+ transporter type 2C